MPVKTDPAYPPVLYEARAIASCTATSPTVCTSVGNHYFDYQTGDSNFVYIQGNSQIPNGVYIAVSSNG